MPESSRRCAEKTLLSFAISMFSFRSYPIWECWWLKIRIMQLVILSCWMTIQGKQDIINPCHNCSGFPFVLKLSLICGFTHILLVLLPNNSYFYFFLGYINNSYLKLWCMATKYKKNIKPEISFWHPQGLGLFSRAMQYDPRLQLFSNVNCLGTYHNFTLIVALITTAFHLVHVGRQQPSEFGFIFMCLFPKSHTHTHTHTHKTNSPCCYINY